MGKKTEGNRESEQSGPELRGPGEGSARRQPEPCPRAEEVHPQGVKEDPQQGPESLKFQNAKSKRKL